MTGIWFDAEKTSLNTYGATTNAKGVSTIKIVISTTDEDELSSILRQLREISAKQQAAAKASKTVRPVDKSARIGAGRPQLPLTDGRGR